MPVLPDPERLKRIFTDESVEPEDGVDLSEFGDYAPVLSCGVLIAFLLVAITLAILSALEAPRWIGRVLMLLYGSLPLAGLMLWAWNKPALRLPSGLVLQGARIRLYIGLAWGGCVALLGLQLLGR